MKNQTGFSAVEGILILVIVGMLGFTGWFVWHSQQSTNKTNSQAVANSQSSGQAQTWTYLPVNEWGVKVRIPKVADPEYILVGGNKAFLTSKAEKADPNCHETDGTSLNTPTYVAIVRAMPKDAPVFGDYPGTDAPKTVQAMVEKDNNATKVGNYYYYILKGNGIPCNNAARQTLDDGIVNKVKPDVQAITAQVSQAQTQKYLTISEWGVKVPLGTNSANAGVQKDEFEPNTYFIILDKFKGSDCNSPNGSVGYFIRFKSGDMDGEAKRTYLSEYPDATKFGPYYYGFGVNPAYVRCSTDTTVQNQVNTARSELKESLSHIQSIN